MQRSERMKQNEAQVPRGAAVNGKKTGNRKGVGTEAGQKGEKRFRF